MKYHYFAFWVDKNNSLETSIRKMSSGNMKLPNLDRYLDYLAYNENMLDGYMGHDRCFLNKEHEFFGGAVFTDGVWIWDSHIGHYIKEHNFQIPEEFIKQIEANNFTVPHLTEEEIAKIRRENWWIVFKDGIYLHPYAEDIEKHRDNPEFRLFSEENAERYKEFWE